MDIQRKAFDQYFKEKYQEFHNEVFDENGDDRAIIGYSFAWSAWQAVKAQAVPEGFVLVPKEPTEAMYIVGTDKRQSGGNTADVYKAMIEAQEQKG